MKRILVFVGILSVVGIQSCSGPTEPDPPTYVYPLEIGNQWLYRTRLIVDFPEGQDDIDVYGFHAMALPASSIDSDSTEWFRIGQYSGFLLDGDLPIPMDTLIQADAVYANRPSGLFVRNSPGRIWLYAPKLSDSITAADRMCEEVQTFDQFIFPSLVNVALTGPAGIHTEAHYVLPYPTRIDWKSEYRELAPDGRTITHKRRLIELEAITVPAGTFDCVRIDGSIVWESEQWDVTEYYASVGLVRRVLYSESNFESPEEGHENTSERVQTHVQVDLTQYYFPEHENE